MGETIRLEIDEDEALQDVVVENEIDMVMLAIQRQPLLPFDEREAASEFQQEFLKMRNEQPLQVLLQKRHVLAQPQELQDERIAQHLFGSRLFLRHKRMDRRLLAAFCAVLKKPLEVERVDLPLELAHAPQRLAAFFGVILPSLLVFDRDKQPIVAPAQLFTQCLNF